MTVRISIARSYGVLFLDEEVTASMVTQLLAEIFWWMVYEFWLILRGL